MNRLVRLYPAAWRERYLIELDDLLTDRPPTLMDQLDIIRGAFDAWLHPQLATPARQHEGRTGIDFNRIAPGAAAVVGGSLWIAGGLAMNAKRMSSGVGDDASLTPWLILVAGAVVSALAAIDFARSLSARPRALSVAARAMLVGAVLIATPWPILVLGFYGYVGATVVFGFLLPSPGDRPLGGLLSIAALTLLTFNTEDERALMTIPIGLVWIAVGALAVRRAPAAIAV